MKSKLLGIGIVALWLATMTALVRMEYSERVSQWDEVSLERVTRKVLENPDPIRLIVFAQKKQIGHCRVDFVPPTEPTGTTYRAQAELMLTVPLGNERTRVRVTGDVKFSARLVAEQFRLRGAFGTTRFDVQGGQTNQPVAVTYDLGDGGGQREMKFDSSATEGLTATLGLPAVSGARTKAYYGRFNIGAALQRAYLIETRLGDALWAKVWVDEAGQVAQVDTSAGITMRADTFGQEELRRSSRGRKGL